MKTNIQMAKATQCVLLVALLISFTAVSAHAQHIVPEPLNIQGSLDTRFGAVEFDLGNPTEETVQNLYNELDFQRAVQAYLWALPIVAFEEAREAQMQNAGTGEGALVHYEGFRSVGVWLTANVTTPYIVGFFDLAKTGPLVIELPAGLGAGMVDDAWQRPVSDLGVSGPDGAQGGMYLVLGPEQAVADAAVDFPVQSQTQNIVFMYRVMETDPEKAAALQAGIKVYPYSKRFNPPETKLFSPKKDGDLRLHIQPRGLDYWERLHAILQREVVGDRDRFFMAMLKPLGIQLGHAFEPDVRQTKILQEASLFGEASARANSFSKLFHGALYRESTRWDIVIQVTPSQDLDGWSQIDERAAYTYEAMLTSGAMVTQTPGSGQAYLGAYRDSEGRSLDGGKTYRLRVPPDAPAKQFWSATVYDLDTRTLIRNEQQRSDRSSRSEELVVNDDGSIDIWFGPKAPKGKEGNWIPTVTGRAWFTYLRLYAPLEPYFAREWPLPDIELVK